MRPPSESVAILTIMAFSPRKLPGQRLRGSRGASRRCTDPIRVSSGLRRPGAEFSDERIIHIFALPVQESRGGI